MLTARRPQVPQLLHTPGWAADSEPAGATMQARAMREQLQDTAAQIFRARDRLRKQDARSQAKRGSLHMTLTQIIVACLLVQVCGDAGATAGLWIRHTKTRTRKQRKLMKAWEQDRLQLLAQLLHDEKQKQRSGATLPPRHTRTAAKQHTTS